MLTAQWAIRESKDRALGGEQEGESKTNRRMNYSSKEYLHVCVHLCVCVYIYIYIKLYIHVHTHIYYFIHKDMHTKLTYTFIPKYIYILSISANII